MSIPETWRPIPDWPMYEVSDHGRVRRSPPLPRWPDGIRTLVPNRQGYPMVTLTGNGRRQMRSVHSLVAETFLGPCPHGHEVNHIDGDKRNAHVGNLEYVTRTENRRHAYRLRLQVAEGEQNGYAKLTDALVREMRRIGGRTVKERRALAARFGVSYATVLDVLSGRTWAHVTDEVAA